MVIVSMAVSLDGFVNDRAGGFGWSAPGPEQFRFHLEQVGRLGAVLMGRRLYETMLVWETDPAMRHDADSTAFAEHWSALPKVVFSATLDRVAGNARLATASLAEEVAAAGTEQDVEIGGAGLAAAAIELDLVDELCLFRNPILLGGGTPLLPPVARPLEFALVEVRTFASRVVFERHRRVRA